MHRPRYTSQKYYFFCFLYSFILEAVAQDLVRLEGLGKLKKFIHLIEFQASDLQAFSKVFQPTRYRIPT
jgi:hypothetical protein